MSQFELEQFITPLTFPAFEFEQALDNYDIADPHRRQDEFDDINTAPIVNAPLYDTSITNPIEKSNIGLSNLDLDTAENYVDFIKNSIKNIIASENEFNIDNSEIQSRMNTVLGI
jgi:hypothetical protein